MGNNNNNNNRRINDILSIQNLSSVNHPSAQQQLLQSYDTFLQPQLQHFQLLQQQLQLRQQQQQQFQQLLQLPQFNNPHHNIPNNNNNSNSNNSNGNNNKNNDNQQNVPATNGNIINNKKSNIKREPTKKDLIDLITCSLCKGYLIDAVTLDLCMHTFCKACAIKYIREKPRCPECYVEIKDKRSLHRLKPDHTIQNLVYKLVPGLYEKEMQRRRTFYAARPTQTPRHANEMFGDIPACKAIKPDDKFCIGITCNEGCLEEPLTIYLSYYPAITQMSAIKKYIYKKFGLGNRPIKIYYGNSEIFFDSTTIMDVAATYNWKPEENNYVINFSFALAEPLICKTNSSIPSNSDHDLSNGPSKSPC